MKIAKTLNQGIIAAVIVSALSFFLPIIPCKKDSALTLCNLPNPFSNQTATTTVKLTEYYGLSTGPLAGLVLTFLAVVLIVLLLFTLIKKKKGKVMDLTKK